MNKYILEASVTAHEMLNYYYSKIEKNKTLMVLICMLVIATPLLAQSNSMDAGANEIWNQAGTIMRWVTAIVGIGCIFYGAKIAYAILTSDQGSWKQVGGLLAAGLFIIALPYFVNFLRAQGNSAAQKFTGS